MKAHSLVHSITSQYCMYEQTCIYTAYNPQSQREKKKSIVGIFTTTISPKKHSMAIILTMKHFKGTQHEHSSPVSPEKNIYSTHPRWKKTLHIFACMFFTTRQTHICTAVTHISEQESKHTAFTVDLVVPEEYLMSPRPNIYRLTSFFISILILHSVCLY